jgi:diadenosine tetraphosphate (Ap4A) HIT family hydrolase
MKNGNMRDSSDPLLVKITRHFVVAHAAKCVVPGYLIIQPLRPVRDLWMLSRAAAGELGRLQAACAMALNQAASPLRVYCLAFGEESRTYHCHVFPRSEQVTSQYLKVSLGEQTPVSGPVLFDWARTQYRGTASRDARVCDMVEKLRSFFEKHATFV